MGVFNKIKTEKAKNMNQELLIQQAQSLKKTITGKEFVSFQGFRELLAPRLHKKFSVWQSQGLVGVFSRGVSYFSVSDFNRFLTGILPENKLN